MIETIFINSRHLNRKVKVRILRPQNPSDIYLYFYDGQNMFDKESSTFNMSWQIDKVLEDIGLEANVVGIHSKEDFTRVLEYLPAEVEHPEEQDFFNEMADLTTYGVEHGYFIVDELIPVIENKKASIRLIGGASMGGVSSLYMGQKYPDIFNLVLAMSTSVWIGPEAIASFAAAYDKVNKQRVYLSVGTKEGTTKSSQKSFVFANRMLKGAIQDKVELMYEEKKGAKHNEKAWHNNLSGALKFLFELE